MSCLKLALLSFLGVYVSAIALDPCKDLPHPLSVTLEHIQGNGIGYKEGYTSLDFFMASPYLLSGGFVPFVDARAHVFNNGLPAANAGAGVRYLTSRVWGVNTYYDYRNSHGNNYNQVSGGLESLGKVWDFRINGYLPFGPTKNVIHSSDKLEFALKASNAEVGVHFKRNSYLPLYFALGPYYITGEGETSWGGSMRLSCDIISCFHLEAVTSYDSLFGWVGQGQLGLTIRFGFKKQKKDISSEPRKILFERVTQAVAQHEIIALKKKSQ